MTTESPLFEGCIGNHALNASQSRVTSPSKFFELKNLISIN